MKHPTSTVLVLLILFFSAQAIGMLVLNSYIDTAATAESGVTTYRVLPGGIERPEGSPSSVLFLIIGSVLVGTILLLFIIKFRRFGLWKIWYFLAVSLSLGIAWSAFIPSKIAGAAAVVAASIKVLRPNFIIHNLTELFIYSGLAVIFAPVLNIATAIALLLLISVYDMYAVWKSKHMVSMAKFQSSSSLFAGISVPRKLSSFRAVPAPSSKKTKAIPVTESIAVIGGGDIGFPLLFAGVAMSQFGFAQTFVIPVFATLALAVLFLFSKKGKFYPAMPFVTAGCLLGYGLLLLQAQI